MYGEEVPADISHNVGMISYRFDKAKISRVQMLQYKFIPYLIEVIDF